MSASETVSSPESELKETDQPVEQERTGLEVIKKELVILRYAVQ